MCKGKTNTCKVVFLGHLGYVRLSRNLYIPNVRLRTSFLKSVLWDTLIQGPVLGCTTIHSSILSVSGIEQISVSGGKFLQKSL